MDEVSVTVMPSCSTMARSRLRSRTTMATKLS
jgi:hypothetical protein